MCDRCDLDKVNVFLLTVVKITYAYSIKAVILAVVVCSTVSVFVVVASGGGYAVCFSDHTR